ncbi:MAG TPA: hypothetical protein VD699_00325 [Nitrosopumilaceae archaeon]|nr:hypothetical protein [Nitrosopumilaceae archaeon]
MAIEKWVAAASLGLFVMFVAEIITVFNYLSNPTQEIQPGGKILQYISIGVAPAVILAGTSYLLSRRFGSRFIGSMIIAGGAILLAGMYLANIMVANIPPQYLVTEVTVTPPLFMAVSIPVMIVGGLLFRLKPKPKKIYY